MRRPDPSVAGPVRATLEDIEALNRLFTDAFTERYHRDGLTGVRVPYLSRAVWRYAIEDAGEGAMLWRDGEGQLVAFNMVHRSGTEGWMGPLAVRPGLQGSGLGTRIVRAGVAWLRRHGCTTIGLETMPRTTDNIGFYGGLGFVPGFLTVSVVADVTPASGPTDVGLRLSRQDVAGQESLRAACRALTDELSPGVDYTRELVLTAELGMGDTTVLVDGDRVRAFALWHDVPLAQGRTGDEIRVLKVVARDLTAFGDVIAAVQAGAATSPTVTRIAVRCQTGFQDAYTRLLADGFRVHWTDLRMTMADAPERVRAGGIVLSNWEI